MCPPQSRHSHSKPVPSPPISSTRARLFRVAHQHPFALLTLLLTVACCSDSHAHPSPTSLLVKALTTSFDDTQKSQTAMIASGDVKALFTSHPVTLPPFQSPMPNTSCHTQERLKDVLSSLAVKPSFVDDAGWPTPLFQNLHFFSSLPIPPRPMEDHPNRLWLPTMPSIVYLHLTPVANVSLPVFNGHVSHRDCLSVAC